MGSSNRSTCLPRWMTPPTPQSKLARYRDQRREIIEQRIEMREIAGPLYAQAYESVALDSIRQPGFCWKNASPKTPII